MRSPDAAASWDRAHELRGALNATAAMLPFVLSYGFIAFGALGIWLQLHGHFVGWLLLSFASALALATICIGGGLEDQ